MRQKSLKNIATEKFVDEYISNYGVPPTYEIIQKQFSLKSKCAAYARCSKFRHKLNQKAILTEKIKTFTRIKCDFIVPTEHLAEFTKLLSQLNKFL